MKLQTLVFLRNNKYCLLRLLTIYSINYITDLSTSNNFDLA